MEYCLCIYSSWYKLGLNLGVHSPSLVLNEYELHYNY